MKRTGKTIILALAATLVLCVCTVAFAAQFTATADPSAVPAEGGSAVLSVAIYNDSQYAMEKIAITQGSNRFFSGTDGVTIPAGESMTFQQTVTVPASLVGTPIQFSASWTENGESKSGSFAVTVLNGGASAEGSVASMISATRTASSSQASQGEVITLTYTITNNGVSAVSGVSITDRDIGGKDPMVKNITVEPGIPYVFTYEYTMGRSTVTSAPVITYSQADGTTGTVTIEEKTLGMVKSKINIEVNEGTPTAEGQTFTLKLTNDGNQKISKLSVKDELGNSVSGEAFALAIGESTSFTYTVPTDEMRNVVFYVTGTDATGTSYSDNTTTYVVRKYIDPSLIGIKFSATVAEPLDASGSISIDFIVENSGSLEMKNLALSEAEYGVLYQLASLGQGAQTINQRIAVGSPRDLVFTMTVEDPSGNVYTYNAYITADYVGVESESTAEPDVEMAGGDLVSEVGGSVSNALRTVLIVLIVLTVIAGITLIVLTKLEKEERRRIARRRAQREKQLRAQLEAGGADAVSPGTTRIPGANDRQGGPYANIPSGDTRNIPRQ